MNTMPLAIERRRTRRIRVGAVAVGGGAPVSVQTMTKTDTRSVAGTVAQIRRVSALGCDMVRIAVPDEAAARVLRRIRKSVDIPVIADIHFDYRLALLALDAGVDGLRINPGNIGGPARVKEIVRAAEPRGVPIRIGVNGGSLEKAILSRHGGPTAGALVESALGHVRILEDFGFRRIKISVKASDAPRTVAAYRLLSARTRYPLHLGVTEAGTFLNGAVSSGVAIGILLAEGIGDTIRVSLTDSPEKEVKVGLAILRALGLRPPGPSVVSCPTCGRTAIGVAGIAAAVEDEMERLFRRRPGARLPVVAIMGCAVNGPGEAREADIALAGGKGKAALYVNGRHVATVTEGNAARAVMEQVRRWKPRAARTRRRATGHSFDPKPSPKIQ